jgi:predicted TIM-barrel fold metal-dependent hydrolase
MDLCGIDTTIISPHVCIGPDYKLGNRHAYAAAAKFPGRIVPFVTVNPNYGAAEIRGEIAYWEANGGIQAFKLHPSTHHCPASGEDYFPVYEYAQEHSLPILSHCWDGDAYGSASVLSDLAGKYPQASFIIGHSASGWPILDQASAEAARRANVYLDLTGSRLIRGLLEDMVSRVGAERVLFGTDNPFIDPRPGLGRVLMARLSDDDKRNILGLNAKELFRL